jgi:hypothetical protein
VRQDAVLLAPVSAVDERSYGRVLGHGERHC